MGQSSYNFGGLGGGGFWKIIAGSTPAAIVQTTTGGAVIETPNFVVGAFENNLGTGALLASNPPNDPVSANVVVPNNSTAAMNVQDTPNSLQSVVYLQSDSVQINAQDLTAGASKISELFVNTNEVRAIHAAGAIINEFIMSDVYILLLKNSGNVMFAVERDGKILTNQSAVNAPTPLINYIATIPVYDATGTLIGNIPVI